MENNGSKKKNKIHPTFIQRAIFKVARPFIRFRMKRKYDFSIKPVKMKEPFILMPNHLTESDMMFAALSVKNHFYFVCSEHLFRQGFISKLLKRYVDPIPMFKGSVAAGTTAEILKRVRDGNSICIFPEGSRTFDGRTNPIAESTGKLVKHAGCALVTVHMTGGYFVAPRWTKEWRRGPVSGEVVRVYSKDEIAKMSIAEVNEAINRDLWEDAYETQKKNPKKYIGKNPAENIENVLYMCPKCGALRKMYSKGNTFGCKACGSTGIYDDYGMLKSEDFGFETVPEWLDWENSEFDRMCDADPKAIHYESENVTIHEITRDHEYKKIGEGTLVTDFEGFHIAGLDFDFLNMSATEYINCGNSFLFSFGGKHYDMTADYLCGIMLRNLYFYRLKKETEETGHVFDQAK